MCSDRYSENAEKWLESGFLTVSEKEEIRSLSDAEKEERFSGMMKFGTAGLRSKMGMGTKYMNKYTVAHATAAFAEILTDETEYPGAKKKGVAVACDSRNNSKLFSEITADVLTSYGIKVYLFDDIRPTPVLSYAVIALGCIAGINITASHNSKEYNGYKAYLSDGAQIGAGFADRVAEVMEKTDVFCGIKRAEKADRSLITVIGDSEIDGNYIDTILKERVNPVMLSKPGDFKVVYTPLFGAGAKFVPRVLRAAGFNNIYITESQEEANGNFDGLEKPNPETEEVFAESIKIADKIGADLIIATDPDSDRVGTMVRNKNTSRFERITGNQMGVLLLDYICTAYEETRSTPEKPYAVKSIVTTEMAAKVCKLHNIEIFNCLTGFKNIGRIINTHLNDMSFILGFEESYGYLKGCHCRDKDAVVTSMLIVEMASYWWNKERKSLLDVREELFKNPAVGYFYEQNFSVKVTSGGDSGMKKIVNGIRNKTIHSVAGEKITEYRDYLSRTVTDRVTGNITETSEEGVSDVLYYVTEKDNRIVIRPSGTEPIIKVYILAKGKDRSEASYELNALTGGAMTLFSDCTGIEIKLLK